MDLTVQKPVDPALTMSNVIPKMEHVWMDATMVTGATSVLKVHT